MHESQNLHSGWLKRILFLLSLIYEKEMIWKGIYVAHSLKLLRQYHEVQQLEDLNLS
jgi:hypothetical protein